MSLGMVSAGLGALSAANSLFGDGGGGGGQQVSKEPWAEAAPWLKANLKTGQNLQGYYEQNPFNSIQRTAYQNTLGDIDNFRQNVNPGLMAFANRLMNTNYSRTGGNPSQGPMPQGGRGFPGQAGMAGAVQGGQGQGGGMGSLGALFDAQSQGRGAPNATMDSIADAIRSLSAPTGRSGPFTAAPGQAYGLIDFKEMNPFTATNGVEGTPATKTQAQLDEEERLAREKAAREAANQQFNSPGDTGA